jgi:tetratricopeptide (TPR) repeat protein
LGHKYVFRPRVIVAMAAVAALPLTGASAQRNPPAPVPRVMVATFQSADKELGVKAADELRNRITRDVDARKLIVIPKGDIAKTLEASGYPTNEALQPNDAKALATLLRADEYVDGVVTKTPTGVKVEARMILSRDQTLGQPLPVVEAGNIGQAASQISKTYQQAREQLAGEKNCYMTFREGKHAEAVTLARNALSKYPNGTIAMVCLVNAYNGLGQKDSVLAVANRIIAVDPRNIQALRYAAQIYQERNDTDKAIPVLIRLMAADPGNDRLREDVIASLVRSGKADLAVPIVEEAIAQNPGDPKTLNMGWRVFLAANQFQKALSTGEEMARADTALADSSYFIRSAAAAASIDPARAAQIVSQGVAKFPTNTTLLVVQAATLSKAGQNAQALTAINRALAVNPKVEGGYAQKALILSAMNMPDSVLNTLKLAAAGGGDKKTLAQVALKSGSDAYKAGNVSKNRADLQRAVQFLTLSNQLDTSTDAQFLAGASAFLIGQSAVNEAQDTKSCTLARLAKENFGIAQENVPAGLQAYKDAAQQLLTAIPQFTPAVDDQIRRFCK